MISMGRMNMKILNFSQLYSYDFNLNNIAVYNVQTPHGKTSSTLSENGRVNQGFVFVCNHYFIYSPLKQERIRADAGEILYLPQYSRYSHTAFLENGNEPYANTIVVNFNMSDCSGETIMLSGDIFKITPHQMHTYQMLFHSIFDAYSINMHSPSKVKSLTYSLFTALCSEYKYNNNPHMKEYSIIQKAIQYIEQNNDTNISIKELADMCYISENSFRRLFKLYAGMLPVEYINKLKVDKAKVFLRDRMFNVCETAQILGFKDAAYFSRVFKKYTGQAPGKFK